MKLAETVTFGGSGLDRRAELRSDAAGLARLAVGGTAHHLAFWRGKPLLTDAGTGALARLDAGAPVLARAQETPVFLGYDCDAPVFAQDVSAWEPDEGTPESLTAFFDPSVQSYPGMDPDLAFAELRGVMAGLSPRDAELAASAKAVLGWHISHRFCSRCGADSRPAQGGWQRDCPACGGHHFPRTDPVVIMLILSGNKVLVGRSPGWPEGMYSLLAGFVEPGETLEAAVRREVFEESGIRVGQVEYLASQPWPFPASLMFGCSGVAKTDEIALDPAELEDALWVSREDMLTVFAGEHPVIRAPRKGAIARFVLEHWLRDRLD